MLIFLAWSWQRSIHFYEVISYGEASGGRGLSLSQRDSLLIATWVPEKAPAGFSPGFHRFGIFLGERDKPTFPALFSKDILTGKLPPSFRSFYLPHWFVMFLFLFGWTTFLILRGQRMQRLHPDTANFTPCS